MKGRNGNGSLDETDDDQRSKRAKNKRVVFLGARKINNKIKSVMFEPLRHSAATERIPPREYLAQHNGLTPTAIPAFRRSFPRHII